MKMRMSNFQSLESPGGLKNVAKQTRTIFQSYQQTSEPELRSMALGVLIRAKDVG